MEVDSQRTKGYYKPMKKSTAVKKARSAYKLAQMLHISRQAVSKWGDRIPAARVLELQALRPEWFARKNVNGFAGLDGASS